MTKDNVQDDHSDELTIAYMSGVHRGKELAAQRQWVGLTDEEVYPLANEHLHHQTEGYEVSGVYNLARAIEYKLREKNATSSLTIPDALTRADCEGPEYTSGWNDCRAEMLKGMK
jgi:hypothetical protein